METEFLRNIKNISIEVIIISILIFGLTMLIKFPIKRATAKLEENKRKALNTFIVFIPMILSFALCSLYYGLLEDIWFDSFVFDSMCSAYLLAIAIYAVFCRIVIVIKGFMKNGDISEISKISEESIIFIKQNIENISNVLKVDKEKIEKIINEIDKLIKIKNELTSDSYLQKLVATEKIDSKINELTNEKLELEKSINKAQEELNAFQKSIN